MKKSARIIIGVTLCLILVLSWFIAVNSKTTTEKQRILIDKAAKLMSYDIYIRAVPLLEEAIEYDTKFTIIAENELKRAYLALLNNRGFPRRYVNLLERQMNRKNAEPEFFMEAANHFLSTSKTQEALAVLRDGIERTNDIDLITLYENSRYVFEMHPAAYENVTSIFEKTVQVKQNDKWGIASADGTLFIPCEYDKISTFGNGQAIVRKDGNIYAIDKNNNRLAITSDEISDFGNYADKRIPLQMEGYWRRATGEFELGTSIFEGIGMYSGGYAAAKINGKWGVIDLSNKWLLPAEYEEIVQDELGRCYAQGAVFIRSGGLVYLFTNGEIAGEVYEDAHPFTDEGYAAVKRNEKWGFIDINGTVVIPFIFDDALSFGQHLAAVKIGDFWGYINIYGHVVIEARFFDAKSFSDGSAPVLTERGWQFITLLEYKKGAIL